MVDMRRNRGLAWLGRMNIFDTLKTAFVRKLGYILAAAAVAAMLSLLPTGKAHAHTTRPCNGGNSVCDQGQAASQAPLIPAAQNHCVTYTGGTRQPSEFRAKITITHNVASKVYAAAIRCQLLDGNGNNSGNEFAAGSDNYAYIGTCQLRTQDGYARYQASAYPNNQWCSDGCVERTVTVTDTIEITSPGHPFPGLWKEVIPEYTGATCTGDDNLPPVPPDKKTDDMCTTFGSVKTCKRGDKKTCITTLSSGRTFCYGPSENGPKTDTSRENAADSPPPNNLPRPPNNREGENWVEGTQTNTAVTTNNVTTTTNVTTYSNTSPAPNSPPVAGDGSGTGGTGQHEGGTSGGNGTGGDGDGNTSTGGGTCGSEPVSSGDPVLAQIALQAWATRCAISDRNKAQDEGAEGMANDDDGLGNVTIEGAFAGEGEAPTINENLLGSGGGTCSFGAELSLMGKPIEIPAAFWELAGWIGMLIVASAYLWVAHQLGG